MVNKMLNVRVVLTSVLAILMIVVIAFIGQVRPDVDPRYLALVSAEIWRLWAAAAVISLCGAIFFLASILRQHGE